MTMVRSHHIRRDVKPQGLDGLAEQQRHSSRVLWAIGVGLGAAVSGLLSLWVLTLLWEAIT